MSDVHQQCTIEYIVAAAVTDVLLRSGVSILPAALLADDRDLARRDFAELGLTSLDWMDLATILESQLDFEFDDSALLDSECRTIVGWASYICRRTHCEKVN